MTAPARLGPPRDVARTEMRALLMRQRDQRHGQAAFEAALHSAQEQAQPAGPHDRKAAPARPEQRRSRTPSQPEPADTGATGPCFIPPGAFEGSSRAEASTADEPVVRPRRSVPTESGSPVRPHPSACEPGGDQRWQLDLQGQQLPIRSVLVQRAGNGELKVSIPQDEGNSSLPWQRLRSRLADRGALFNESNEGDRG